MTHYTLWVARDQSGALRIFDDEPKWAESIWVKPYATVRRPEPPNTTTWERRLPSHWFPGLKPAEKVPCRLEVQPSAKR